MFVQLKVAKGSQTGRVISISGNEFIVGRAEDCDLRPNSEAVSRRHCEIKVSDTAVEVRDLGSRNGTIINGDPIEGSHVVKTGDHLVVGPLEFEFVVSEKRVNHTGLSAQEEPMSTQRESGASTQNTKTETSDVGETVSQWLDEFDDLEKQQDAAAETQVLKSDETNRVFVVDSATKAPADETEPSTSESETAPKEARKQAPKKLPTMQPSSTKDSQEAAAQMLKKLFNRG